MSKRDRAKGKAKADVDDVADAAVDTLDDDAELRPSGKRAGSSRRGARTEKSTESETAGRRNPFTVIWTYLQQVVAEMKKVIWPTRRETIMYTLIVLIFIVLFTLLILGLDQGFAWIVLKAFGGGKNAGDS
ncbi:MAG: preprotein translocase subunit SecE [Gordonia sp. (in: high G+C Gram-positive bacteria)]|uniref:preprotein translocase subunit SecE n=1 Tax=Gordonia sp. (in: high G+C Gram-positive bacteria) TaxID=84139 RepID=UPI0039E6B6F4